MIEGGLLHGRLVKKGDMASMSHMPLWTDVSENR